jgi:hypothetical protein
MATFRCFDGELRHVTEIGEEGVRAEPGSDAARGLATGAMALAILLAGFGWFAPVSVARAADLPEREIFYPARACTSRVLDVEVWQGEAWKPHPDHPRVVADSCQAEAANQSLHEIRIRCVDPNGRVAPSPWRVGVGLRRKDGADRCRDRTRDEDGAGVVITSPTPGEEVTNQENRVDVEGRIGFGEREAEGYEILIAIDVSGSTQQPSGVDVDGDGELGIAAERRGAVFSTDPDDSILAAEVNAVRMLVDRLEPGLGPTRVGLLTFSGQHVASEGGLLSRRPGVRVEAPLTDDFVELAAVLDQILARGSGGSTDFFAAVDRSMLELSGRWDALSDARPGARKVLLLLTDGIPSPQPAGAPTRARALLATREADGVATHIYALGGLAEEFPKFVRALLQDSAGSFTRVSDPSQAASFLDDVSFSSVQLVEIENLTTKQSAEFVSLRPDGHFSGQIPVRSGRNVLMVTGHAPDGRERRSEFELRYVNSREQERLLAEELARQAREKQTKSLEIRAEDEAPSEPESATE